jgi:hypothetical protein
MFYVAIGIVMLSLLLLGIWSRVRPGGPPVTAPMHDQK